MTQRNTEIDDAERFEPPVDIIIDPPGHQAKRWKGIKEVQYDGPDALLDLAVGGTVRTNRRVIRVADDDPGGRSLQTADDQTDK